MDTSATDPDVVPVFFLSDSTGISAETMGNALLIQFPERRFERTLIPFITTVEHARKVVAMLDALMDGPVTPLVFTTAAVDEVRQELALTKAPIIDFFSLHMGRVEEILGERGIHQAARLHGMGDVKRYNNRMAAVEFTIEHDDGQSSRAMERADVILLAPQLGLFVANYPLVDEDLESDQLPRPVREHEERCFGLTTTVDRLSRVRGERRPNSHYASVEQCRWELRRAKQLFSAHRVPVVDTSARSVEEISTVIMQQLARDQERVRRQARQQQQEARP
jgi:[pyruvate, water dikinase]-phosphate phosphotransferase / [pyruvate, water dikinase] kinase